MGATGSLCTDGWWTMSENTQMNDKVSVLEQKCATADASHIAIHTKCSELESKCEQLQLQLNVTRIELQRVINRVDKTEQQIASLDLQQHAMMENEMIILQSS
jgi:hypothetical protein